MHKFVIAVSVVAIFVGCSRRSLDSTPIDTDQRLVTKYGSDAAFDIATWNIEQFPLQGRTTVSYLAQIIRDMDLDLFGIQEINDSGYFNRLLDSLPAYEGYVSDLPADILKLAIIYKKDLISISTPFQIFTSDWYAFPRPPVVTYVEVKQENKIVFDFTLIILHLKALGDPESVERRRDACQKLKSYIDDNLLTSADKDVIVIGDYNDELDKSPEQNVFNIFLSDTANYSFLTLPLIGQASYIGSFNSLIDHLLITNDSLDEYQHGTTQVLYLEKEFDLYTTHISDHRPVYTQFFVF